MIANKKIEDLIRFFHAYHTIFNPRSRLLLVGAQSGFERYLASLHQLVGRARRVARALRRPRLGRGAGRLLRHRRSVSVRQRARRLLRAARRGVLQAGAGARVRRDRRAVDDGRRRRAVRGQGSAARRGADGRDRLERDAAGCRSSTASSPRSTGCGRRTSPARCSASSIGSSARPRAPAPHVAFDFWEQFDAAQELEELRLYRPAIYQALPAAPTA